VYFVKSQLGAIVPSTHVVAPLSERFVTAIEQFVNTEQLDLVTFEKHQRKDDVAQDYRARFDGEEGVLFVGKAQEKASVFRTEPGCAGEHLSLDHPLDRDGQSLLLLSRRPGLRADRHQVPSVLSQRFVKQVSIDRRTRLQGGLADATGPTPDTDCVDD